MANQYTKEQRIWLNDEWVKTNGHIKSIIANWPTVKFGRPPPSETAIYNLRAKFLQTGSIQNKKNPGRPKSVVNAINQTTIQQIIAVNPKTSTRRLALASGIKRTSCRTILKNLKLKSYIPRPVQELKPTDPNLR